MTAKKTQSVAQKISALTHSAEYRKHMKTINRMMNSCEEKTEIYIFQPKPHTLDYFRNDGFSVRVDNSLGYERYVIVWTYGEA